MTDERALDRRAFVKRAAAAGAVAWATPNVLSMPRAFAQASPIVSPGDCEEFEVLFMDTFEQQACGIVQGLTNWTILAGSIDIIGGEECGHVNTPTRVVDLDGTGSPSDAWIETNQLFHPGEYELEFDLGGSQRPPNENAVRVTFGPLDLVISLPAEAPLTTFRFPVVLGAPDRVRFDHRVTPTPHDNIGLLLDNVIVRGCPS